MQCTQFPCYKIMSVVLLIQGKNQIISALTFYDAFDRQGSVSIRFDLTTEKTAHGIEYVKAFIVPVPDNISNRKVYIIETEQKEVRDKR